MQRFGFIRSCLNSHQILIKAFHVREQSATCSSLAFSCRVSLSRSMSSKRRRMSARLATIDVKLSMATALETYLSSSVTKLPLSVISVAATTTIRKQYKKKSKFHLNFIKNINQTTRGVRRYIYPLSDCAPTPVHPKMKHNTIFFVSGLPVCAKRQRNWRVVVSIPLFTPR